MSATTVPCSRNSFSCYVSFAKFIFCKPPEQRAKNQMLYVVICISTASQCSGSSSVNSNVCILLSKQQGFTVYDLKTAA